MPHTSFLEIINRDDPKLRLAYSWYDRCWGWYGYVGMGQYDFQIIRNQDVLRSVQYYHQHNLLRKVEDIYIMEVDCLCTLYELAEEQ